MKKEAVVSQLVSTATAPLGGGGGGGGRYVWLCTQRSHLVCLPSLVHACHPVVGPRTTDTLGHLVSFLRTTKLQRFLFSNCFF